MSVLTVHTHLMLVHIPVVLVPAALVLALIARFKKHELLAKVAACFFVFSAVVVLPAYLSGEEAEETVEHMPGVTEAVIHPHEESGEFAFAATLALGALSLLALWMMKKNSKHKGKINDAVLAVGLLSSIVLLRTAMLGGQVRHTEIREGAVAPVEGLDKASESEKTEAGEENEHDDD